MRLVQIYGRFWFKFFRPPIDRSPAPPVSRHQAVWTESIPRPASMDGPLQFRFLNHRHTLPGTGGWEEKSLEKLWLYNLHYFDDLNAENFQERTEWHQDLINRWVVENEPGKGTGWDSYPTSLRIVNWIKRALAGHSLEQKWLQALAIQIRWLQRRLERHLMGNHLFANAKALIFAGAFFEKSEADSWLKTGLQILDKEIPEQVLEDGGHFELSPMYHAIILEDILDLVNVARTSPEKFPDSTLEIWRDTAENMLGWLAALSHPDGEIAFFNDAAFGISSTYGLLRDYAARLGMRVPDCKHGPIYNLASSGYVRMAQGDAVALLDVARAGPDYIPGHAHADTLSFEFSLFGHRLFVNSGTSLYEKGAERLRQRGTAAHNTVQIDGENSSEVWASFRVAKRARPSGLKIHADDDGAEVQCSHDGYLRLPGKNIHHRSWRLNTHSLEVSDRVSGSFQTATSRFHLHPSIRLHGDNELKLPNGKIVRCEAKGVSHRTEKTTWHPEFGKSIESQCLVIEFNCPSTAMTFSWH